MAFSASDAELREILLAPAPRMAARTPPADAAKAADALAKEAAKVALYCLQSAGQGDSAASGVRSAGSGSRKGAAAEAEFRALVAGFQDALAQTITLLHGTSAAAGPTLQKAIHTAGEGVLDASMQLLRSALIVMAPVLSSSKGQWPTGAGGGVPPHVAALPQLAGRVEAAVKRAKGVGADDRVAVGRALTRLAASVKDVCREIGEMLSRAERGGEEGEEEDDDIDIDDTLDPLEATVARGILELCSAVQGLMRELLYAVAKWPSAAWDPLPAAAVTRASAAASMEPPSATDRSSSPEQAHPATERNGPRAQGPESNGAGSGRLERVGEGDDGGAAVGRGEDFAAGSEPSDDESEEAGLGAAQVPEDLRDLEAGTQALELLLARAKEISEHVDELGASLYPPQEIENLHTHCQGLQSQLRGINRILCAAPSADPFKGVLSAAETCDEHVAKCQALLQAAP